MKEVTSRRPQPPLARQQEMGRAGPAVVSEPSGLVRPGQE